MGKTKFDRRFFESTRGQIVTLLHGSNRTVNELADALNLTDNAVRAHLLSLERDGLVEQTGMVKGFRKPHFTYGLSHDARHLFPRSYDVLFNGLLDELKITMEPDELRSMLADLGRTIGREQQIEGPIGERLAKTVDVLKDLGGAAKISVDNERTAIKSDSCPFAESVIRHDEVCQIAESMVSEILGKPVREKCDRTGFPKCCFEIDAG
jgi:predicted ArsR family transcriptional regulator